MAFSFFNRDTGESVRIVLKPVEEKMEGKQKQEYILSSPAEELFEYKKPSFELPHKARLFSSYGCEKCGESTAELFLRIQDGKKICTDCYESYSRGW